MVPGQDVTLGIRPERIRLADAAPVENNTVEGTLEEILFVGNDTQYIVRLKNGARITVREQNQLPGSNGMQLHIGQAVKASWSPAGTNTLLD
jgi:ABC-type Fe3+/spermidine/putrescine transport system ATPase subunit